MSGPGLPADHDATGNLGLQIAFKLEAHDSDPAARPCPAGPEPEALPIIIL